MGEAAQDLDFALLDDLAIAIARGRISANTLPPIKASKLGPLAECLFLSSRWSCQNLRSLGWLEKGQFSSLVKDTQASKTSAQRTAVPTGWICADQIFDTRHYHRFRMSVGSALNSRAFGDRVKHGVIAMLQEFRTNVHQHANGSDGCLAAFHANASSFEVLVADRGRGVVQSLKDNPEYADLDHAGKALRLAITDGVSRHTDPRRGRGFNELFLGLANRFSHIRLRSGDHALEVIHQGASAPVESISVKPDIPGLFIYARFDKQN